MFLPISENDLEFIENTISQGFTQQEAENLLSDRYLDIESDNKESEE